MRFFQFVSDHKVVSFILGTILLQAFLLGLALFSREVNPQFSMNIPSFSQDAFSSQFSQQEEEAIEQRLVDEFVLNGLLDGFENEAQEANESLEPFVSTEEIQPFRDEDELLTRASFAQPQDQDESIFAKNYVIRSGDTLARIWQSFGLAPSSTSGVVAALKEVGLSPRQLQVGSHVRLSEPVEGVVEHVEFALSGDRIVRVSSINDAAYTAEMILPTYNERERTVSGTIQHSLSHAAQSVSLPYDVVDEFVDLFGPRIEFSRDLHIGNSFSVTYTARYGDDGTERSPGPIRSASLLIGDTLLAAFRYVCSDGKARYFDERGKPIGNYFLRYPVKFSRISSTFSKSRFHPVLKRSRPHNGVDFAAPTGTPVRSVADGVIVRAGYYGGAGNMVRIRHTDRYSTAYMHLSVITKGLRPGARVDRGQVIGKVGSTGLSTGPHLHYELYDNGKYVDPMKAALPSMPEKVDPIPTEDLHDLLQLVRDEHEQVQLAALEDERKAA